MADSPLVSIVTPSYNQGRFIRATIESVLSQDYPRIEYIVMDGGSTDETPAVVKEYGSRVRWISEPDRGQSHAINKGFRMAQGEILSWLNSDDLILPGAVSHAVKALSRHPTTGGVYGEGYLLDTDGRNTGRFPHTEAFNLWKLAHLSDYILQQTVYFRRSALEVVGYLDESLHYGMDWDILIRLGKRFGLQYVPEYMGCLREYPDSKTSSGGTRRIAELGRILQNHTGQRVAPGYIIYGLDWLQRHWRSKILSGARGGLRLPAKALAGAVYLAAGFWIFQTIRRSQGWYSDGWAAPRLRFMLPPGKGNILIRGSIPRNCHGLRGQRLKIERDGRLIAQVALPFGDFAVSVPVPEPPEAEPLHLTLRASRFWIPFSADLPPDLRRLCYVLRGIDWEG